MTQPQDELTPLQDKLLGVTLFGLLILITLSSWVTNPPTLGTCPGCNKTIWLWQKHQRRESTPVTKEVGPIMVSAGVSSFYHADCPATDKPGVSIEIVPVEADPEA